MIPQQNFSYSNVTAKLAFMNDRAIMNYQSGNYMAALTILNKTLTFMREVMHNANHNSHQDQQPPQRYTCQAVTSIALSEDSMYELGCLFPFYARPFQLVPMDDDEYDEEDMMEAAVSNDTKSILGLHLVVVLYNTALVYHAMGVHHDVVEWSSSNNSLTKDECFQKALHFYRMVYQVVQQQEATWDCSDPDRFCVLCALYNNMAFVDSYSKNFHQVNYWLGCLVRLMQYDDQVRTRYDYSLLDAEERQYFFTTTMIFQWRPLTLAPAA